MLSKFAEEALAKRRSSEMRNRQQKKHLLEHSHFVPITRKPTMQLKNVGMSQMQQTGGKRTRRRTSENLQTHIKSKVFLNKISEKTPS